MPKATKKKPIGKAVAAALEILNPVGGGVGIGTITFAGRNYDGSGVVCIHVDNAFTSSGWPEWAYGVAEGALRFGKQVLVVYTSDIPWGANIWQIYCLA